jgi:isopentenyl diphosphate isomerase/L-lactate dehydrogenase-like FMN-dependent dehydrogenase
MDFEERARAVLPPHTSAYYAAAAGSGVGLDEGTADWSAVGFRPRVLREVDMASVSMTILPLPDGAAPLHASAGAAQGLLTALPAR